jgi:TolB protein
MATSALIGRLANALRQRNGQPAVKCLLALVAYPFLGCSMQMSLFPPAARTTNEPTARAQKQAAPDQPQYLPDSLIDDGNPSAEPSAPVVNVFGEFTRTRRGPAALLGDPGLKQHTFLDAGYDADVTVDPTGKWMAFSGARDGERSQIFLQLTDGTAVTQLTNTAADDAQPCFSPDGKRIAFSSNRSGRWHLYVMNVDGRGITQITDGPTNDMHPSFSPDGTRLVYSSQSAGAPAGGAGEQWQISTIDLVSREQKLIGPGLFPAWSPRRDRDVIAFQKTRARGSRWFSLWTCELPHGGDGEPTAPRELAVSSNAALVSPAWSPDGRRIAFASIVDPAQTRNGRPQGQQDIWIVDTADGASRRRLTDGIATNLTPCWAVDNRVYFVSDRSGHECIWSLPATMPATPKGNEATAKRQDGAAASPRPAQPKEMEPSSAANDPSELKP